MNRAERSLRKLVEEYHELNSPDIAEFTDGVPSPLELSRFIMSNRPVIIRSYARQKPRPGSEIVKPHLISSIGAWSRGLLLDRLGDRPVRVARSPDGKADSILDDHFFVEPAYEEMSMRSFLHELSEIALVESSNSQTADVLYLQSQDGNLHKELKPLLSDVGADVPIASAALGDVKPDAVNIWIGDDRSITSLHQDPYENFYLVIEGSKTFTLFPPIEFYCMHEAEFTHARYVKHPDTRQWSVVPNTTGEGSDQKLPWIPIDPLKPDFDAYPRFRVARPMKVVLLEGDMLYLPSLWYHHVRQRRTRVGGLVVACNWWYDMKYDGPAYALSSYIRREVLALDHRYDSEEEQEAG